MQPGPQDKKHQKLVRHNDSSSKVNIDLYLFQPPFHRGRPVWCVWCLESAAALSILVHSVIKNRLKVTVKYQPLTPQKWWQSYTWRPNTFNGMAIFCTQQKTVSCCWFVDDAVKILRGCQNQDVIPISTKHTTIRFTRDSLCSVGSCCLSKQSLFATDQAETNRRDKMTAILARRGSRSAPAAATPSSTLRHQKRKQYRDGHRKSFQLIIERWSYANPTIVVQYIH